MYIYTSFFTKKIICRIEQNLKLLASISRSKMQQIAYVWQISLKWLFPRYKIFRLNNQWKKFVKIFYVPQPQKLVFPLQLRVKQCCIFRYRGIQWRNWTAHVHYSLIAERNLFLILLLLTSFSYSGTQSIPYSSFSHCFFV